MSPPPEPAPAPDRARERLELLSESGRLLASTLEEEVVLRSVIDVCMPRLADFGFFDLVEETGGVRRIARAYQSEELEAVLAQTRWQRSERTDINVCALSTGKAALHAPIGEAWLRNVATSPEHLRVMRSLGFSSMITAPVAVQGRLHGALTLFFSTSRRHHDAADLEVAEELGRRAATTIENVRLHARIRKREAEAQRAARRKDEFIAMLGHELRNPLMPIQLAVEMLRSEDVERRERSIGILTRQTQVLIRLVDDLLQASRVVRGKVELRRERISLQSVTTAALQALEGGLANHRVQLHLPEDPVEVDGDAVRLEQIAANVIGNAAKYTPAGGAIEVVVSGSEDTAELRVRDDGIGISAGVLPYVFELFEQDDRDLARTAGGLGIGLSIVRGLVEMHGGRVTAQSDGPGQGSEFVITLPRLPPAEHTDPERDSAPAEVPVGLKVLVVDDNADVLATLSDVLRAWGCEVHTASDGALALEQARQFSPSVVFLDLGLPELDGYEVARRMRREFGRGPLLIALSGYGQRADRSRALEAGFDDHLRKPASSRQIAERLRALCIR